MGGRTTCLLPALFLLIIPGSSAISGPGAVRGVEQDSLTVRCRYNPGYETYVKWWCRGADWSSCRFVVKTTGSEKEVKKGRVSIKDNWKDRSFTVTMEKLRLDDSDTYRCGIERVGSDLADHVDVTIDPGKPMSVCERVSSGPALSRDPTGPQRECPRGGGVLRAHRAPADHLGWEQPGFPSTLSWLQGRLRVGSGFPSTLFPCAQSVPEPAPKRMKVVVPVSVCGPRGPPLWDLETPIPASAFLGPLLCWGCSCSFWNSGLSLQNCNARYVFHTPSQGEVPA
ncbi:CMRF35-like molecule 5 [Oryx dammah]|uniref:CMRF35-like molecule 5 n=1 Tax=Oryx dammah TaxID=59534 RepID=UPI001A9AA874|nr:CMRF35-like molecule 5 [Oryx dammah]